MSEAAPGHTRMVIVLCCLAQFMVILDVSIINVALPAIRTDLGFDASQLHWVINAYTLAFGGFILIGGRAADIVGRREVFLAGLSLLVFGSLLGGVARSEGMLLAARVVQGLGAAAAAPASLSILMMLPEGGERNRALATWALMGGVGGSLGGVIGGLLTDLISWRWVLLINVPVGLVLIAGAIAYIPAAARTGSLRRQADVLGALTITSGMLAIIFAIAETEAHGWFSARTLGSLLIGAVLVGAFVWIEARVAAVPMIPLRTFRSRDFSGSAACALCLGAASFAMWVMVSLFCQNVLGYSALRTGLVLAPASVIVGVAAQVGARLCERIGGGAVLTIGLAIQACGMLWLTQISPTGSYLSQLFWPLTVTTAGMGLAFVAVTVVASTGVGREDAGLASGAVNATRQLGASLGVALLSTVAAQHTAGLSGVPPLEALSDGYAFSFFVGCGFAVLGAILALLVFVRGTGRGHESSRIETVTDPVPLA